MLFYLKGVHGGVQPVLHVFRLLFGVLSCLFSSIELTQQRFISRLSRVSLAERWTAFIFGFASEDEANIPVLQCCV